MVDALPWSHFGELICSAYQIYPHDITVVVMFLAPGDPIAHLSAHLLDDVVLTELHIQQQLLWFWFLLHQLPRPVEAVVEATPRGLLRARLRWDSVGSSLGLSHRDAGSAVSGGRAGEGADGQLRAATNFRKEQLSLILTLLVGLISCFHEQRRYLWKLLLRFMHSHDLWIKFSVDHFDVL